MGVTTEKALIYGGAAALGLLAVYVITRGIGGAAQDATRGAVNAAGGVVTGAAKGAGDLLGIPDTDAAKCEQAKAAGDTWNASFYCDVGDFLSYAFSSKEPTPEDPVVKQSGDWNTYDQNALKQPGTS